MKPGNSQKLIINLICSLPSPELDSLLEFSTLDRPLVPFSEALDHSREVLLKDGLQELIVRVYDSRFMFLFSVNAPSRDSISAHIPKVLYSFSHSLIVN